jgi:hypothetical protein
VKLTDLTFAEACNIHSVLPGSKMLHGPYDSRYKINNGCLYSGSENCGTLAEICKRCHDITKDSYRRWRVLV